jgi:hypothetical protein
MNDNPYAAPQANVDPVGTEDEAIRRAHLNIEASLKAVGNLYLLSGVLILFGAAGILLSSGPAAEYEGITIAALFLAIAIAQGIAGFGLRKLKRWARPIATVLSVIGLIGFPIGTMISGYVMYLLWSRKGRTVLQPEYQDVINATPHVKYKTSIVVWILLGLILMLVAAAILVPVFR